MVDEYPDVGVLGSVATYLLLVVVLHPLLLVLLGGFGVLLSAPTSSFGPSIVARSVPQYERVVTIASWTSIAVGSLEIAFYYGIWPRLRRSAK